MTVEEVQERVAKIAAMAGDDEAAHTEEDNLREAVLFAISQGAPNARELAHEALQTNGIDFARWCA